MTYTAPERSPSAPQQSRGRGTVKPPRRLNATTMGRRYLQTTSTNVATSANTRRYWQRQTSRLPLIEVALPTLTATEEQLRQVRLRWWLTVRILATLAITMGSIIGAVALAHAILKGMPTVPAAAPVVHTQPTVTPMTTFHSAVVAVGATQSYAGVTVTVDMLRLATRNEFVAAPTGKEYVIVSVHILNGDARRTASYNARNFVLIDRQGQQHLPDFAALAQPLGAGELLPQGKVTGDIAYLVTVPTLATAPDPELWYIPDQHTIPVLGWSVPLLVP